MPSSLRVAAACSMVCQSEVEPMMMPTSGFPFACGDFRDMRRTSLSRRAAVWKMAIRFGGGAAGCPAAWQLAAGRLLAAQHQAGGVGLGHQLAVFVPHL